MPFIFGRSTPRSRPSTPLPPRTLPSRLPRVGTYQTFFVASEADLERLFPGWHAARPERVMKETVNPFTKQKMTVPMWQPVQPPTPLGKPSLYDDVWGPPLPPIAAVENDYMAGIEQAGAPGLRALPHFRGKNYHPFVILEPLAAALVGPSVLVPPARIGCPGDDDAPSVDALPDVAVKVLATLDDARLGPLMDELLAADVMGSGEEVSDEARAYFIDHALRPLRALAIEAARRGARVCHYYALHY